MENTIENSIAVQLELVVDDIKTRIPGAIGVSAFNVLSKVGDTKICSWNVAVIVMACSRPYEVEAQALTVEGCVEEIKLVLEDLYRESEQEQTPVITLSVMQNIDTGDLSSSLMARTMYLVIMDALDSGSVFSLADGTVRVTKAKGVDGRYQVSVRTKSFKVGKPIPLAEVIDILATLLKVKP